MKTIHVTSNEEVAALRSQFFAIELDKRGVTVRYYSFPTMEGRQQWVAHNPWERISLPAHCVPLSILLDRESWEVGDFRSTGTLICFLHARA